MNERRIKWRRWRRRWNYYSESGILFSSLTVGFETSLYSFVLFVFVHPLSLQAIIPHTGIYWETLFVHFLLYNPPFQFRFFLFVAAVARRIWIRSLTSWFIRLPHDQRIYTRALNLMYFATDRQKEYNNEKKKYWQGKKISWINKWGKLKRKKLSKLNRYFQLGFWVVN